MVEKTGRTEKNLQDHAKTKQIFKISDQIAVTSDQDQIKFENLPGPQIPAGLWIPDLYLSLVSYPL